MVTLISETKKFKFIQSSIQASKIFTPAESAQGKQQYTNALDLNVQGAVW